MIFNKILIVFWDENIQMKDVTSANHDHLVRFLGACVDHPNICILSEHCPKKSLYEKQFQTLFKIYSHNRQTPKFFISPEGLLFDTFFELRKFKKNF